MNFNLIVSVFVKISEYERRNGKMCSSKHSLDKSSERRKTSNLYILLNFSNCVSFALERAPYIIFIHEFVYRIEKYKQNNCKSDNKYIVNLE